MAEHMSAAKAAKHAIRTRMNHDAILYFIAAMAGMAAIFVLYHLLRLAVSKRKWTSDQNSKEPSLPVAMGR